MLNSVPTIDSKIYKRQEALGDQSPRDIPKIASRTLKTQEILM